MAKKSFLGSFLGTTAKAIDKAIKASAKERERQRKLAEKERIRREKEIDRLQLKADKLSNKNSSQSIHNVTDNLYRPIASGNNIIYASNIPKTVDIGNLIFEKRYKEAIKMGKELLASCTEYSYEKMIHINLMQAYFNIRLEKPEYFDSSTYHAKQAIICGHNTGLAQERLVINLEKTGKINQAIQLCEIIISPKFHFSKNGFGTKDNFKTRHSKLLKKIAKAVDNSDDSLFTGYEKELIFERSKLIWY
jgi:hypothetical protein